MFIKLLSDETYREPNIREKEEEGGRGVHPVTGQARHPAATELEEGRKVNFVIEPWKFGRLESDYPVCFSLEKLF